MIRIALIAAACGLTESGPKKALENPGAIALYTQYAGKGDEGIPFFLILDANGKVIQDAQIKPAETALGAKGANTGCPDSDAELTYFDRVLHETSGLSDTQIATIRADFAPH